MVREDFHEAQIEFFTNENEHVRCPNLNFDIKNVTKVILGISSKNKFVH